MSDENLYHPPSADLIHGPARRAPIKSALLAVLAGVGIDFIGTNVVGLVAMFSLGTSLVPLDPTSVEFGEELVRHPLYYWPMVVVGVSFLLAAGYAAGRWASHRPVFFAGVAGVSSLLLAALFMMGSGLPETAAPRWFDLGLFVLHVPIACLGGWLAGRHAS